MKPASASGMTMLADETKPFVLLDDARPGGAPARLYRAPLRTIVAATPAEVPDALKALRAARTECLHAAGYLSYEAGAALQPRAPVLAGDGPLLWFGLFDRFDEIAPDAVAALLPDRPRDL
jgi:para-aminobenzoate synthetase/4-amino-4-deoxychorismate lyase